MDIDELCLKIAERTESKIVIPNYNPSSTEHKNLLKEIFRCKFSVLVDENPKWKIEIPDFDYSSIETIYERYETVKRTLLVYKRATAIKLLTSTF